MQYTFSGFPFLFAILVFVSPCQLPFLGSLLLTTCSGWSVPLLLARLFLATFEFFAFSQMLLPSILYAFFMLLAAIILLWDEAERKFVNCAELNLIKYRKLQVLEKLINSCVRGRIFPVLAVTAPYVQVMCVFVAVKFHFSLETSHLVALLMLVFLSVLFNVIVFSGAGHIHIKSCRWLVAAKIQYKSHKIRSRVIKSMIPLRIWFSSNFVSDLTALVVQHFCICQTMNLLLLSY